MEIQEIIKNMTLEEKSHLVNGATFFGSYGIDRLGVPRMQLLDGATGMNLEQVFGDMTEYEDWSNAEERKQIDADTSTGLLSTGHFAWLYVESGGNPQGW